MRELTKAQRRAYIETARRSQPIEELERKSKKAIGRQRRYPLERVDVSFAREWRWGRSYAWTDCGGFCYLCHRFGVWAGPLGYIAPPEHATRCNLNPVDDGPYPGWADAGRAALQHREPDNGK